MLSFATEFPILHHRSSNDFFKAVDGWILGSPHTRFRLTDISAPEAPGHSILEKGSERIERQLVATHNHQVAGIRYTRRDDELEWITTVIFFRGAAESWVGIRVSCESIHPAARLPPAKKPVVVRSLLTELGGAADGLLQLSSLPRKLRDSEIDIAARLMLGNSNCRLPIVYVSVGFHGNYLVDPKRLARALSGMAHVVVEPNRPFSIRLKLEVRAENVYGGTVGVYWPDGGGRRSYFIGRELESPEEIENALFDEVQTALTNRRPLDFCTWPYLQEVASRQAMDTLRASGSQEVEKFVETFDQELAAKEERLQAAEREVRRLQAELRRYEARLPLGSTSLLRSGREQDLYPREILGIVSHAISDATDRVPDDSRRKHVLRDVLAANQLPEDPSAAMRERLKEILRGSKSVDARVRRGLEDLGFTITDDGKHYKIEFQGDERYVFALSKSGSDHRAGLNAASKIGGLLF